MDLTSIGAPLPPVEVTASYQGMPPYPCLRDQLRLFEAACPAALASSTGAGRYEIVARAGERTFRGSYERLFNGCTTSDGPVTLSESP